MSFMDIFVKVVKEGFSDSKNIVKKVAGSGYLDSCFFDIFKKVVEEGLKDSRDMVNKVVGSNYRDIYFTEYPNGPYVCKGCGKIFRTRTNECTVDHIIPRKYGGTNSIANLQILCRDCNQNKGHQIDHLTLKYSGDALIRELQKILHY